MRFNRRNPLAQRLGQSKRWVIMRLNDGHKRPAQPGGRSAKVNDPSTWRTFDECLSACDDYALSRGEVMPALALVGGLLVVDFDKCISGVTLESDHAAAMIQRWPTYAEVSQSQRGLHLFYGAPEDWAPPCSRIADAELYTAKRFIAVTGWGCAIHERRVQVLPTKANDIAALTRDDLDEMLRMLGYAPRAQSTKHVSSSVSVSNAPVTLTPDDVRQLSALMRKDKFARLWSGDASGYASRSEAELALVSMLSRALGDPQRVDRVWRASPLAQRAKTQTRADYRARTIGRAVSSRNDAAEQAYRIAREAIAKEVGDRPAHSRIVKDAVGMASSAIRERMKHLSSEDIIAAVRRAVVDVCGCAMVDVEEIASRVLARRNGGGRHGR